MPISCGCQSCGAQFKAPSKLAGRTVKCPRCDAPLRVPAAESQPGESGLQSPSSSGSSSQEPVLRTRDSGPAIAAKPHARRPASASRSHAGTATRSAASPQVKIEAEETSVAATRGKGHRRPKKKSSQQMLIVAGLLGVAAAVMAFVVGYVLLGPENQAEKVASAKEKTRRTSATEKEQPSFDFGFDKLGTLVLDWPESDRANAAVDIDGDRRELNSSGKVTYELPEGEHRVVLRRRGYEQVEYRLYVRKGEEVTRKPDWKEDKLAAKPDDPGTSLLAPSFDDWLQDFENAKRRAAAEEKDLLVLFAGSDWCEYSKQMARLVFFQPEFRKHVDDKYLLVFVDFPRHRLAKAKVENAKRNEKLSQHFEIQGFPTIVLTDELGQPYGQLGYDDGGLDAFKRDLSAARSFREERDALFAAVEENEGDVKLAAEKAVEFLDDRELIPYYGPTFERWYQLGEQLDPKNEQGTNEVFFEVRWSSRIWDAFHENEEPDVQPLIVEFEQWKSTHQFKDPDRAGRLHLQAAWLIHKEKPEDVGRYAAAGLAYGPQDPDLRDRLAAVKRMAASLNILGSGSGFVVAENGYIMTNHHVIKEFEAGRLVVRLPGKKAPVPAEVLASDASEDLALIKVDLPEDVKLQPLRFSTVQLERGTRVGAFGYPLGDSVGKGLKLTTGIVSATQQQSENGMVLLDCRVNPGNSGGPLCDVQGNVVGIVTAKSRASSDVDSYGMAVPSEAAIVFLKKNLPDYTPLEDDNPFDDEDREWNDIDREVSPSVLMILLMRK